MVKLNLFFYVYKNIPEVKHAIIHCKFCLIHPMEQRSVELLIPNSPITGSINQSQFVGAIPRPLQWMLKISQRLTKKPNTSQHGISGHGEILMS